MGTYNLGIYDTAGKPIRTVSIIYIYLEFSPIIFLTDIACWILWGGEMFKSNDVSHG